MRVCIRLWVVGETPWRRLAPHLTPESTAAVALAIAFVSISKGSITVQVTPCGRILQQYRQRTVFNEPQVFEPDGTLVASATGCQA